MPASLGSARVTAARASARILSRRLSKLQTAPAQRQRTKAQIALFLASNYAPRGALRRHRCSVFALASAFRPQSSAFAPLAERPPADDAGAESAADTRPDNSVAVGVSTSGEPLSATAFGVALPADDPAVAAVRGAVAGRKSGLVRFRPFGVVPKAEARQAANGSAFVGDAHPGYGSRLGACYSRKRGGIRPAPCSVQKTRRGERRCVLGQEDGGCSNSRRMPPRKERTGTEGEVRPMPATLPTARSSLDAAWSVPG